MDFIQQTFRLIAAFGIQSSIIELNGMEKIYDKDLRKILYRDFDYMHEVQKMDEFYDENGVYIVKDNFEENYISMRIPEALSVSGKSSFMHIGPYLVQPPEETVKIVMSKNHLPSLAERDLIQYYYGIPYVKDPDILEALVITQAGYITGLGKNMKVNRIGNLYGKSFSYSELIDEIKQPISFSLIEERYEFESAMLKAVKDGNYEKALEKTSRLMHLGISSSFFNNGIRKNKNKLIVENTLFRKAVQEAGVHPAHIDRISSIYAEKIELCSSFEELKIISGEMIKKYCDLVREHSLQKYTETVRNALNYIDFHMQEDLTLKKLAEAVNVSATYLSGQFRKETGKTITDYINEKRINNSLVYIAGTDMSIQKIAEMVGILDENYFSRLFKRYKGRTAIQYRNLMRAK